MSASSTTDPTSRSPSPHTPEPSDSLDSIVIEGDPNFTSSWFHTMQSSKPLATWPADSSHYPVNKTEEEEMLHLDELIEQHAYDDSPAPGSTPALSYSSPSSTYGADTKPSPLPETVIPDFRNSNMLVPSRHGPIAVTKPVPPPASLPRKPDPGSANQRLVFPPRESCINLPIMFPSIPEGGTKSRVETQVRVTVDLADGASSDPYKYDRVGSWKWLKLPPGTATKRRTRKQGKIDPELEDILHLSATVTCASSPHSRVLSCSSCQAREAKRVAKKLAARVRPARSESESEGDGTGKTRGKQYEDTTSIIQFNCAEILDFSAGSVVLPLRITCYCRHHREKVGFNVHFAMADHTGRIVGSGISRPIMITDDHKTATTHKHTELVASFTPIEHHDWSSMVQDVPKESKAPSRRKKEFITAKKRPKPYDSSAKPNRLSPEATVSSTASPSSPFSPLPTTRASTPSSALQTMVPPDPPGPSHIPPLHHGSETSSPDSLATPLDHNSDVPMPESNLGMPDGLVEQPIPPPSSMDPSNMMMSIPHSIPFMFFDPRSQPSLQLQLPTIHRLIPNTGPTHGGVEVTVLGANFHPSLELNCVFGDVRASATQRWSDNTLVCILPPRATPGVVAVWFEGFPKTEDQNTPLSLFTYSDGTDRQLMELALQVVGLKMTGKIEDAKNVAMRIVGNASGDNSESHNTNTSNIMQLASSSRDLRPLLFPTGTENKNFEKMIIDFLSIVNTPLQDDVAPKSVAVADAISHPCSSGQTLLHLSALSGFAALTAFLIANHADVDARDRNGFTPLHFATLSKSKECAKALLDAGADLEVVNALGKTPAEISADGFFDDIVPPTFDIESPDDDAWSTDEDADLGDAEEEADVQIRKILTRRISRRTSRVNLHSGRATPRRSVDISRATTPPPPIPTRDDKGGKADAKSAKGDADNADAKRAASFMEKMYQRTLAQFPAPQGIIPQLPFPNLPAVPWGALPQVPMVFPVFVPMAWPSFRTGEAQPKEGSDSDDSGKSAGPAMTARAVQEWRTFWEKWMATAAAATTTPNQQEQSEEMMPPPVYTPRAAGTPAEDQPVTPVEKPPVEVQDLVPSSSSPKIPEVRPLGYDNTPVPEKVVDSFGYRPPAKQTQKLRKKHDRMLILFWIPILLLSMLWAFHNGVRLLFDAIRAVLPARTILRT